MQNVCEIENHSNRFAIMISNRSTLVYVLSDLGIGRPNILPLATNETRHTRRSCFISTKHRWRRAEIGSGGCRCLSCLMSFSFREAFWRRGWSLNDFQQGFPSYAPSCCARFVETGEMTWPLWIQRLFRQHLGYDFDGQVPWELDP